MHAGASSEAQPSIISPPYNSALEPTARLRLSAAQRQGREAAERDYWVRSAGTAKVKNFFTKQDWRMKLRRKHDEQGT